MPMFSAGHGCFFYIEHSNQTFKIMKITIRKIVLFTVSMMAFISPMFSQTLPPMFVSELVSSGWDQVEGFTFDANKNMYVWEKNGYVWKVDSNGVKAATPLVNIREEVGGWRDHGLNGFALDPAFMTNGYIYLMYTVDRHHLLKFNTPQYNANTDEYFNATIIRVTRYQVDVANNNFNTLVPNSRFVLVGTTKKNGIPLLHESHSGGQLVFGDDGTLLISTGDGASYNVVDQGSSSDTYWSQALTDSIIRPAENVGAFRSQLVNCLAGKILRIDPMTGAGLPSNPFYNPLDPQEARSKVWCLGLRNPFRMTIRRGSGNIDPTAADPGTLYIGDVGWTLWEDLHTADAPGQNFGWPLYEGIDPNTSYQATNTQNLDAPNPLFGTGACTRQYFYFKELLKQATLDTSIHFMNPCNSSVQIPANIPVFFHERPDIDWKHGNQSRTPGYSGLNSTSFDLDNAASPVPGPRFGGNASCGGVWYESDRFPIDYQNSYFHADYGGSWIRNFSFDGNDKPVIVRNFGTNLGPVVFLNVHPSNGTLMYVKFPTEIRRIRYTGTINNPPRAVIQKDKIYGASPMTVNFDASLSSDPDNLPMTYLWEFGDGSTSTAISPSHLFTSLNSNPQSFWVRLTVTDNIGQTDKDSVRIFLNNTPPQVNITSFDNGDFYSILTPFYLPLQASVSDAEHPEPSLSYKWQTFLHHNVHEHFEAIDTNRVTQTYITPETCDEIFYYEIKLIVTDPEGLSTTVSQSVYPACDTAIANFTSSTVATCINQSIQFTNLSDQSSSFQWLFPGGVPSSSTDDDPVVTYSTKGTYDVTLISTNGVTTDTLFIPAYVTVYKTPTAAISPVSDVFFCNGSTVALHVSTNAASPAYTWYRNGVTVTGAGLDSLVASTSGNYKVRVTDSTGCSKVSRIAKLIKSPVVTVSANGPLSFCIGDSVVLTSQLSSRCLYQWYNTGTLIPGAQSSTYAAKTAGKFYVMITDTVLGCSRRSPSFIVTTPCRLDVAQLAAASLTATPNPASGAVQVTIKNAGSNTTSLRLIDMRGREVLSVPFAASGETEQRVEIPLTTVENGFYLLQLVDGVHNPFVKLSVLR